jgi:gas vesicle protein
MDGHGMQYLLHRLTHKGKSLVQGIKHSGYHSCTLCTESGDPSSNESKVCFMFKEQYLNPAWEKREQRIKEQYKQWALSVNSEITDVHNEYEILNFKLGSWNSKVLSCL